MLAESAPDKEIFWYSWENEEYSTKANKTSRRKALVTREGPIDVCVKELIEKDILGCNQGFTWVQHFFYPELPASKFSQVQKKT